MNGMDRSAMSLKIKEYDGIQREIANLEDLLVGCTGLCVDISLRLGGCSAVLISDCFVPEIAEKLRPIIANMIYEREKKRDNL